MSDTGRKNFSDKLDETFTPDSSKTAYDKAKETVTDTYDQAAANFTPDSQKSVSQKAGDDFDDIKDDLSSATSQKKTDTSNSASENSKGIIDSAAEYAHQAADYIRGDTTTRSTGTSTSTGTDY